MKTRVAATAGLALVLFSIGTLVSCKKSEGPQSGSSTGQTSSSGQPPAPNPDRNAYFGEEHIHTSWSVDAWVMGNRITGPDDALKYAQGQTIKHPLGYDIKIDTPMDFMGVTDHSEYVGVTKEANTPGSAISKMPEAQPLILKDPNNSAEQQKVFLYLLSLTSKPPIKAFMTPGSGGHDLEGKRQDRRREQPSRASSLRSVLTSGPPCPTIATCIATSSSATAPMCRRCPTARWIPTIPKTYGTGWTPSARRATSCWPFRITPT